MRYISRILFAIAFFGAGFATKAWLGTEKNDVFSHEKSSPSVSKNSELSAQVGEETDNDSKEKIRTFENKVDSLPHQLTKHDAPLENTIPLNQTAPLPDLDSTQAPAIKTSEVISNELADTQKILIEDHITAPFSDLILKSQETIDTVNQLLEQPSDSQWAALTEQRIRDFVNLHELHNEIELHLVNCATTMCEVAGFEFSLFAWETILMDLRKQHWWQFYSGSTVSDKSQETGEHFYFVATLKNTDH